MKINDFIPNTPFYTQINSKDIKNDMEQEGNISSFGEALKSELNKVNDKQLEAEDLTDKFIKGEDDNIHEVMLKTEEAKLSLQLAVQVRNKVLEAYQEINRMQV